MAQGGARAAQSAVRSRPSARGAGADVHKARLARLRKAVARLEADGALISNFKDVGYLTGFLGGDSYLLVPAGGSRSKPLIISDFRYIEDLAPFKPLAEIVIRKGAMSEAVAQAMKDRDLRRVAVQGETMTLGERDAIAKLAGAKSLVTSAGLVTALRRIKDEAEVRAIRSAIKVQQEALLATLPTIRPGQTELEVASVLEAEMKRRGSSDPSFPTIVAAGTNSSRPHYRPGSAKVKKGGLLLIDWGATLDGYHSDMTRTLALGSWPKPMREVFAIVHDAFDAAAAALRPGMTNRQADAVARDHIARYGFGEQFGHGLGHGIGLDIHEEPRVGKGAAERPLEPGNVITVEPGIYLPGVGGVRLEDDFLITQTGARNLCSLPKDIAWATL